MTDSEKLEQVYKAWDMMHFSCDNEDHKTAYLMMAGVLFDEDTN